MKMKKIRGSVSFTGFFVIPILIENLNFFRCDYLFILFDN